MRILIGDTVIRRDDRQYVGIVERRNGNELSVRLPYVGNQRDRVVRDQVEPMAQAMARARRDGTRFRNGLNLVNYGSTLAQLVEAFGYATTERLRRDSLEKVKSQLQRAGLDIECESDRWGRDDRFELSVVSPTKSTKGDQARDVADETAESDVSDGPAVREVSLPTPFWPTALGLEEQRELAFLRALTEADPILCLLDASSGDGWLQPVWEGIVSWAFRGAQRFCHRTLSDAPRCEVCIGSPAMLQAYLRTSILAQDAPRLRDEPHRLNLITLDESEKPVDFIRLRAVWPGPVFEFIKPQSATQLSAPDSDDANAVDANAVLDCLSFAAGCADRPTRLVCPAHALISAREASAEANARASGNLGFLRLGSVETFKGSNESGAALALKARLAQWILWKSPDAQLKFEKTRVLAANDDNELDVVRRTDLSVEDHRYEVETLLGSGPIESFFQQKVFSRLHEDKTPLSLVVPSESFLWAGPYLADLAYHLNDRGKVLLPGIGRAFLHLKPRALRNLVAAPEIPWENMPAIDIGKTGATGAAESDARIKLEDVKGYPDIKQQVDDLIIWPEKYRRFIRPSRTSGILFFGPPGCGKSRLAQAIAGELQQEVRLLSPADLRGVYISWGQIMIREQFDWVAGNERRMLIIDELDAVARSRRNHGNMHTDEMADVNELLVQLDRVSRLGRIVVGTTNYVDSLDDAVVRSGRFGRFIPVPPPDLDAAFQIVEYYLNEVTNPGGDGQLRVEAIAGGEVRALLEAAMHECRKQQRFFCGADLEEAVNQTHRRCCRKAIPDGLLKDRQTVSVVLAADEIRRSLRDVRKSVDDKSVHDFLNDVDRFCGGEVARDMRKSLNWE